MIRILIADDHTIVREGLKQIISDVTGMEVAGEATNGHEVLDKIKDGGFDVVLLDLSMPGKSGLETLKEIRIVGQSLPVLILTMHPEEQYAVRVLKAGASGYLTKESAPDELITAIRKVTKGGKYISPSLAERLAYNLEIDNNRPVHETLSDREYQVFCKIASGNTISEIAEEMSLSVKTISTYRSRILEKMGMKSNAELTYYAIKNQLVY
jgi:two-component system invasion response regulator UvrY